MITPIIPLAIRLDLDHLGVACELVSFVPLQYCDDCICAHLHKFYSISEDRCHRTRSLQCQGPLAFIKNNISLAKRDLPNQKQISVYMYLLEEILL